MKKIVIISGIQIINNPRVVKEANKLASAGYEVEVIGAIFDHKSKVRIHAVLANVSWKHIPVIDVSQKNLVSKIQYFFCRIKRKIAFLQKTWWNIETPNQLGYTVRQLLKIAKKSKADLYIVHLEQALWVGRELIKQGENVAIDMEDWYSKDGLPEDRVLRPIKLISECESYLLNNAVYSTTTSKVLSNALKESYKCPLPKVVYNSFPISDRDLIDNKILDRKKQEIPSLIWFSQTIGPGRGLEELVLALNKVDLPFELHLRGADNRGFSQVLLASASKRIRNNIFFHPQVSQDELLSRLCEHDIGYCGELSDYANHDLTIANKMMEYLRAGLAVIATDTAGHKEVKQRVPEAISIYKQRDETSLISSLNLFFGDEVFLNSAREKSRAGLNNEFGWEKSSEVILESVNAYFSNLDYREIR